MGSSNVIAEAGIAVVNLFKKHLIPEPITSPELIGLCMPQEPEDFQLTVWIYNLEEQKGMVTTGYRPDFANPSLERYSPMQVKLYMLVTAHSKAPPLIRLSDEYRILGRAMQAARDFPLLEYPYLEGSLLSYNEQLNLEQTKLSSDELSKIWNNASKPLKMSFGLSVTVALESSRVRNISTRVSEAHIEVGQKKQT